MRNEEEIMEDQDKTRETLIEELEELRQRVKYLERGLTTRHTEKKDTVGPEAQIFPVEEVWRLPGYWH